MASEERMQPTDMKRRQEYRCRHGNLIAVRDHHGAWSMSPCLRCTLTPGRTLQRQVQRMERVWWKR